MGPRSMLVLLAAPKAVEYYSKIGFTKHNSAWTIKAQDPFPIRRSLETVPKVSSGESYLGLPEFRRDLAVSAYDGCGRAGAR